MPRFDPRQPEAPPFRQAYSAEAQSLVTRRAEAHTRRILRLDQLIWAISFALVGRFHDATFLLELEQTHLNTCSANKRRKCDMNQGELRIMLPSTVPQPGQPKLYSLYESHPDYTSRPPHNTLGRRQTMDLPRPLEPRSNGPAQGPTNNDPQHIDSNGQRPPGQMLPGLRDILTPASHSSPQPQQSTWSQAPLPRYEPRNVGNPEHPTQHSNPIHPPPALHPPPEPHGAYPPQHDRRLDLPILETQPVARQPPPTIQGSSYTTYRGDGRDNADPRYERPRQTSTSSYMTAGAPSPYTPLPVEHQAHRSSTASYDRSGNPPFTPTGAEASKKYLGVKDFPGEGVFHVYDGGYRIPTIVDGETVNPQWGLTKANKPRKRLALACLDCREKKIKCEPGATSCLQCEKAKRPCRRCVNDYMFWG